MPGVFRRYHVYVLPSSFQFSGRDVKILVIETLVSTDKNTRYLPSDYFGLEQVPTHLDVHCPSESMSVGLRPWKKHPQGLSSPLPTAIHCSF